MSRPPKIDRKSLRSPDEFIKRGQQLLGALVKQRGRFLPIVGVALVAVLGVYGYDWWSSGRAEKAWKSYNEAQGLPEDKRFEEFKSVYAKFGSARPGYFAALGVADHYLEEAKKEATKTGGNPVAAAATAGEWYSKALDFRDLLATEKQLVLINRGTAFEVASKFDEAMTEYRKAADLTGDAKGFALLNIGRVFELKSDNGKAVETYEKVSAEQPNTEFSKLAKNNIRRLKSPLFKSSEKKDL